MDLKLSGIIIFDILGLLLSCGLARAIDKQRIGLSNVSLLQEAVTVTNILESDDEWVQLITLAFLFQT